MLRISIVAFLGFILTATPASASCAGADPALTSVAVKSVTQAGGVNRYTLVGTVVNMGSEAQATNALQFVDIYQTPGDKLDAKSIPPLRPGQSHTFSYVALRSTEAGNGTTKLHFQLDLRQPSSPGAANCDTSNDGVTVTF